MSDVARPEPQPVTPSALVEFMSGQWGPRDVVVPGAAPGASYAAARRAAVSSHFPDDWLVIPAGAPKVRANDTDYRFRAATDFAWLTGTPVQEPDAVLVIAPGGVSTLYVVPRADRSTPAFFNDRHYGELWVGPRFGVVETGVLLDVATAPLDELEALLKEASVDRVRVVRGYDAWVDGLVSASEDADSELLAVLSELRLIKDSHEVACLSEAIAATVLGFEDVVRALPEATEYSERWVEGTFNRRARTEGNDVGYDTIAACGHHACTLHWTRNDGPVRTGDLLLLDAGVEGQELYTADVTRTIPISGRFSEPQREVYEVVWRAQQAGLAACRPGEPFMAPHRAAMRVITEWLVSAGILPCTVEEALDPDRRFNVRYTLHGTSHMLGLDVHDCANARNDYRDLLLEPGMVLTVEPGCYLQPDDLTVPPAYRGIGVRIEDDVLITADGCVVLSAALPTTADDVEAWMAALGTQPRPPG